MFYILHGDNDLAKKEALEKLLSKLGDPAMLDLNTSRFSGRISLGAIRQACEPVPFLAPARVALVEGLFASKPDKNFLDELVAYLPRLPQSARLFFLERQALRANHPAVKLARAAENGFERRYDRPKGGQLSRWIMDRVQQKGGRIAPPAAQMLGDSVGNDLQLLDTELEKLVLYKIADGNEPVISGEDVALLSSYAAQTSIFELVDALGNRNGKRASTLLQNMVNEGTEPFYLFSMFTRQIRLLIQVKELAEQGLSPPAIAAEMGQSSFVVGKMYQQARGFSLLELEAIHRRLLDIDVAAKTGLAEMPTSLELLVAELTLIPQ